MWLLIRREVSLLPFEVCSPLLLPFPPPSPPSLPLPFPPSPSHSNDRYSDCTRTTWRRAKTHCANGRRGEAGKRGRLSLQTHSKRDQRRDVQRLRPKTKSSRTRRVVNIQGSSNPHGVTTAGGSAWSRVDLRKRHPQSWTTCAHVSGTCAGRASLQAQSLELLRQSLRASKVRALFSKTTKCARIICKANTKFPAMPTHTIKTQYRKR